VAEVVVIDGPGHWPSMLPDDRLGQVRAALAADRAGTVAGWVAGWYGAGAAPELVAWTVRQILDSGPFVDDLLADQLPYGRDAGGGEQPWTPDPRRAPQPRDAGHLRTWPRRATRDVRRHLRHGVGLAREQVSMTAYWRLRP
jgi:hypothetical protein